MRSDAFIVFHGPGEQVSPLHRGAAAADGARDGGVTTPLLPPLLPQRQPPDPEAVRFAHVVLERSGLVAEAYRGAPLARRLPACLRRLRCRDIPEALTLLDARPDLLPVALNTLLIGVTWFFRDEAAQVWLDLQLRHRAAAPAPPWRVWSAGCSDGAELFTAAMMLDAAGLARGMWLLGSDCRTAAIGAATRAVYDPQRVARLPAWWRAQYLEPCHGGLRVAPRLRRLAAWRVEDLLNPRPVAAPFDLVLCRNVAIYLNPSAADGLWEVVTHRLAAGGLLAVGKAERPAPHLGLRQVAQGVYQKDGTPP